MNYKTSRSRTTATLQVTKRAGAAPQQHSCFQTHRTTKIFDTFTVVPLGCFRVANLWFEHIHNLSRVEHEQELYHSNVADFKTSRSLTPAALRIIKRAGASPQQHCEIQNERQLQHTSIVNYKTNKSVTTIRL